MKYLIPRNTYVARWLKTLLASIAGLAVVALGSAYSDADPGDQSTTRVDAYRGEQLLLSRSADGSPADGPSFDPAISEDNRTAVAAAYVSTATDIVEGSTPGRRNVYLVHRAGPFDREAKSNWKFGRVELVSRGTGALNGDSWDPSFDGDDRHRASCLAFVSSASNLVAGDVNGRADVFIRSLNRSRLKRIASRGNAESVDVDGGCENVAFATSAGVFLRGSSGAPRRIATGETRSATIDTYGDQVAFERSGAVYLWTRGRGIRKIGRGANPLISGNGKFVSYDEGGNVRNYSVRTRRSKVIGPGHTSSSTLTGLFVFWINGSRVDATGLQKPAAACASGPASPATSAHGNYVLYTCAPGGQRSADAQVFLSYIGAK
jgi:hypothetical protein